jgi:hypothetical protein
MMVCAWLLVKALERLIPLIRDYQGIQDMYLRYRSAEFAGMSLV